MELHMALQSKLLGYGTMRRAIATASKLKLIVVHVVIIMILVSCTLSQQPGREGGWSCVTGWTCIPHLKKFKSHIFYWSRLLPNYSRMLGARASSGPTNPSSYFLHPLGGDCGYDPVLALVSQLTFFRKRLVTLMSIYLYYRYLACWHK